MPTHILSEASEAINEAEQIASVPLQVFQAFTSDSDAYPQSPVDLTVAGNVQTRGSIKHSPQLIIEYSHGVLFPRGKRGAIIRAYVESYTEVFGRGPHANQAPELALYGFATHRRLTTRAYRWAKKFFAHRETRLLRLNAVNYSFDPYAITMLDEYKAYLSKMIEKEYSLRSLFRRNHVSREDRYGRCNHFLHLYYHLLVRMAEVTLCEGNNDAPVSSDKMVHLMRTFIVRVHENNVFKMPFYSTQVSPLYHSYISSNDSAWLREIQYISQRSYILSSKNMVMSLCSENLLRVKKDLMGAILCLFNRKKNESQFAERYVTGTFQSYLEDRSRAKSKIFKKSDKPSSKKYRMASDALVKIHKITNKSYRSALYPEYCNEEFNDYLLFFSLLEKSQLLLNQLKTLYDIVNISGWVSIISGVIDLKNIAAILCNFMAEVHEEMRVFAQSFPGREKSSSFRGWSGHHQRLEYDSMCKDMRTKLHQVQSSDTIKFVTSVLNTSLNEFKKTLHYKAVENSSMLGAGLFGKGSTYTNQRVLLGITRDADEPTATSQGGGRALSLTL